MTGPWGKILILKYQECVYNSRLQLFHFINIHPNLRLGSPLLDLPLCMEGSPTTESVNQLAYFH